MSIDARTLLGAFVMAFCVNAGSAFAQTPEQNRSVGILLISHGQIASEMRNIAEHIVGEQTAFRAIGIEEHDNIEQRREEILTAVRELNSGCGVLIISDMFGGTPSNLAISVLVPNEVEVLAGMNIPIVVKSIAVRGSCDLNYTAQAAAQAGRRYINIATDLLRRTTDTTQAEEEN